MKRQLSFFPEVEPPPPPPVVLGDMLAATLWQPWASAIALPKSVIGRDPKRLENRNWAPRRELFGQRIAIHAGKRWDDEAEVMLWAEGWETCDEESLPRGAVVCTARLVGVIRRPPNIHDPQRFWYAGPVAWVLDEVITLPEPVPCRGAQGLWRLPADVEAAVRAQAKKAA